MFNLRARFWCFRLTLNEIGRLGRGKKTKSWSTSISLGVGKNGQSSINHFIQASVMTLDSLKSQVLKHTSCQILNNDFGNLNVLNLINNLFLNMCCLRFIKQWQMMYERFGWTCPCSLQLVRSLRDWGFGFFFFLCEKAFM